MVKNLNRWERYNTAAEAIFSEELEGNSFTEEEVSIIARYVKGELDLAETTKFLVGEPYAALL